MAFKYKPPFILNVNPLGASSESAGLGGRGWAAAWRGDMPSAGAFRPGIVFPPLGALLIVNLCREGGVEPAQRPHTTIDSSIAVHALDSDSIRWSEFGRILPVTRRARRDGQVHGLTDQSFAVLIESL